MPETVLIYDLSMPLLGVEPTYNDGQPQGLFTVVVQCEAENGYAVGVLPTEAVTSQLREEADEGAFKDQLSECT